jgi:hypothetical protein
LIRLIFSIGIPSCSDAICANVVSWPWPWVSEPVLMIASPGFRPANRPAGLARQPPEQQILDR